MTWSRADLARMRTMMDGFGLQARDRVTGDWRAFWRERCADPANILRLLLAESASTIIQEEALATDGRARCTELRAEYDRAMAAGELRGVQPANALDRVEWHEKSLAKTERKLRAARKLAAKIEAEGLPAEILTYMPLSQYVTPPTP